MNGRGKRVQAEETDQPHANKQQKMTDWCLDCKAVLQVACLGAHRVLDMDAAEKDAQAKLQAALQEAALQQANLDALTAARVLTGPVLEAEVARVDESNMGWSVAGGDIRIALAATKELTGEDEKALCAALEEVEVAYEVDEAESTIAWTDIELDALSGLMDKLPDCVEGQAAGKGDVLLSAAGRLEVFFRDMPSRGEPGMKMFGRVEDGLGALEGSGCDGRDDEVSRQATRIIA
ncbi:uncharacterized protein LOC117645865 [Thrips palmi]|uniref:Uncharacterized protein LOC117645865 n=1 Tax=Thrips palmi TaxID=161013 RepID=A0A6P8YQM5_THRPL|nr:uncharacterized protein LOC117645865 [Thrips palmi]